MDDTGGQRPYQPASYLVWSAADVAQGKTVKVKGMPKESKVKLFRVLVSTNRMYYLVINELTQNDTAAAEAEMRFKHFVWHPVDD